MEGLRADIQGWLAAGRAVALATVVRTWGSAPRAAGSKMAVNDRGQMSGSVSGGCVEGAVVEEALDALRLGRPRRLHYGVSDETAWGLGLTCGGEIDLFVQPIAARAVDSQSHRVLDSILGSESGPSAFVRLVVIDGPEELLGAWHSIRLDGSSSGELPAAAVQRFKPSAEAALRDGMAQTRRDTVGGRELEILLDPVLPPPSLAIVGGVHIAIVLCRLAHAVGYRVIVIDPRRAFATQDRFPEADVIDHSWPDEGLLRIGPTAATAVAVLSHDPKLDDPALRTALRSPAFYVGALGSAVSQQQRRARLLAGGLSEEEVGRLHGPIGFNLGRRDPESIALGIMAEIVACRAGHESGSAAVALVDRQESES